MAAIAPAAEAQLARHRRQLNNRNVSPHTATQALRWTDQCRAMRTPDNTSHDKAADAAMPTAILGNQYDEEMNPKDTHLTVRPTPN